MALNIPKYPDPRDPANPLSDAYAWLSEIALDLRGNAGRLTLNVHPNEAAWTAAPVAQLGISLGQILVPATPGDPTAIPPVPATPAVTFPTLADLMADADFASAYNTIGAKLYAAALAHPRLAGATEA